VVVALFLALVAIQSLALLPQQVAEGEGGVTLCLLLPEVPVAEIFMVNHLVQQVTRRPLHPPKETTEVADMTVAMKTFNLVRVAVVVLVLLVATHHLQLLEMLDRVVTAPHLPSQEPQ
jgi:hypothetical protein